MITHSSGVLEALCLRLIAVGLASVPCRNHRILQDSALEAQGSTGVRCAYAGRRSAGIPAEGRAQLLQPTVIQPAGSTGLPRRAQPSKRQTGPSRGESGVNLTGAEDPRSWNTMPVAARVPDLTYLRSSPLTSHHSH